MNKRQHILCVSLAVLLFHHTAFPWSGAGHQVIAAEGYRELVP